ncbi:GAF domain-containing protein [Promicromonospora sp. MEB111]|uniref:sensor histidine kinase n=1 Tax=Promicromonospora sp. MEB111 TaxID=3040301 RepID=UPI00254E5AC4|nr:GAF domain-containing protein [Promicromonospora sp. MEB111]
MAEHARERTKLLLDAMANFGRGLDLEAVLNQISAVAAQLVGARYVALGVLGDDGRIARLLTVGLSAAQVGAIGPYPTGRGILGELIRRQVPLRLHDLSAHPASVGFPANHPPMRSLLGVPLRVHGTAFGNLYLTQKVDGGDFTDEDERLLEALAAGASVAIENAHLYEESRLREQSARANDEISRRVLAGHSQEDLHALIADRALHVADADLAVIARPEPESKRLVVRSASGAEAKRLVGVMLPPGSTFSGAAFEPDGSSVAPDAMADERAQLSFDLRREIGALLAFPLGEPSSTRGVLAIGRYGGRVPFAPLVVEALQGFAAQAAVALELAEHRADVERFAVQRDRGRIARDLHDLAIQRLYATGLSLLAAGRDLDDDHARRIGRAVDEIDETIALIRTTVHRLQPEGAGSRQAGLRSRVYAEIDAATSRLGYAPRLRFDGPVDAAVPPNIADHVVAVLREGLSNVARHAHARTVSVRLVALDDVVLTVADDGVGIPTDVPLSGLRNLARRAADLGGALSVQPAGANGTRLEWRVPLSQS